MLTGLRPFFLCFTHKQSELMSKSCFQMGAIRIANCNLHNQSVGEGVSAAIQDLQLRQYVEQVNNCRTGLQPILRRAYWLEAGSVNLGLITADIALAADHPSKHEVQRHFLETHDNRTKR